MKDVFSLLVLEVDFLLKIEENLFLLTLSSIEIKHKATHCQGENSATFIHKMCKEKVIKRKIVNL